LYSIEKSSVGSMTSPKTASGSLFKNFSKGENLQKISSQKEPETSFNFPYDYFLFNNESIALTTLLSQIRNVNFFLRKRIEIKRGIKRFNFKKKMLKI